VITPVKNITILSYNINRTTVSSTDYKSAYWHDFWRIMWHWRLE